MLSNKIVFNIDNKKISFIVHQISILLWKKNLTDPKLFNSSIWHFEKVWQGFNSRLLHAFLLCLNLWSVLDDPGIDPSCWNESYNLSAAAPFRLCEVTAAANSYS